LLLAFPYFSLYNELIEQQYFIIDFDSTFVTVETLDELANIALTNNPHKETILQQIREITKQGMEGTISFPQSLEKRLSLFKPDTIYINQLIFQLQKSITPSLLRNKNFFTQFAKQIYIISGGFKEYIVPIVEKIGIESAHVLANTFIFDKNDTVTGYDRKNPLSQENGKINAVKKLGLKGEIIVVGDGYTDYQIKEAGIAKKFFAFTEHIARPSVIEKADKTIANFDELLYYFRVPRVLSYPKSKINVLLLENIHENASKVFSKEGYQITSLPQSLSEDELIDRLQNISIVGIGSRTQITKKVAENAPKLLCVARFGIGTNNIDLVACAQKGIAVFNAPFSNTRSVVELALGEIIILYRRVFEKSEKLHKGVWDKTAKNCHELRGKKLGIIGYGNIGSQLSVLAEMMGMKVYFYDLVEKLALGNAQPCSSLEELLETVDVISLHIDGRKENAKLIGEKEFTIMKDGVIFINTARGHVIDVNALAKYIKSGKILGAALDVFPQEPKSNTELFTSPLQGLSNVILTPHIGGRSEEAQAHMGEFVPEKVITFINTGNTTVSVNFPNLSLPAQENAHRVIHIHKNVPGVLADINKVFANHKINIEGQYLKTNEHIGYVITDINNVYDKTVVKELKEIDGTIRVRVLY